MVVLSAFGIVTGLVYWALTGELVGVVLLLGFAAMPGLIGAFMMMHGSTEAADASDDPIAEPSARAGELLGPFPAVTIWPIVLVGGVIVIGASLIYGLILLAPGAALFCWGVLGLARESRR